MNIDFSPKKQFQSNDKLRAELAIVVNADGFHQALSFALAEFVTRAAPSADQLQAVKGFIQTLLMLPAEQQPMPAFPQKTLDHTVYTHIPTAPTTSK